MIKTKKMQQQIPQEQFDRIITLLITYKQQNPTKDVFLSEKSIHEAVQWYTSTFKNMMEHIDSNSLSEIV